MGNGTSKKVAAARNPKPNGPSWDTIPYAESTMCMPWLWLCDAAFINPHQPAKPAKTS